MSHDWTETEGCEASDEPGKESSEQVRWRIVSMNDTFTLVPLLSRRQKKVYRAYGGVLSHKAVREKIVRAFLIEVILPIRKTCRRS